jgi:hypothetical protein
LSTAYNIKLMLSNVNSKLPARLKTEIRKTQLYAESASRYFLLDNSIEIDFHPGDQAHASSVTFETPVMKMELKRNP